MEIDSAEHSAMLAAIITQSILVVVGFTTNCLLIYAIFRHTPSSFKKYSSLLFLTSINDTLCVVCAALLFQREMPTPLVIAQVWHGLCIFISKESCYAIFSVSLHTIMNGISLMVVSFWYRHSVVKTSQPPSPLKLGIFIGSLYLPSFVQMISLPFGTLKEGEVKSSLSKFYPNIDYANGQFTGTPAAGNIFADYGTLYPMIMPIPCYVFILIVRFKALTYHACLPIFIVIADVMITVMLMDLYRHPLLENFVFVFTSLPSCLSPILTFIFIRPYRAFLLCKARHHRNDTNNSALAIALGNRTSQHNPTV